MNYGSQRSNLRLIVAASTIGTVFEWYDFYIFGSLATLIGKHFFSTVGEAQGVLFALLTFAAGFAVRPLGALAFGSLGDRFGRKRAFLITITLMGLATFSIGLLPGYAQWGIVAPYVLVSLRVLQGFAVGGEYGGAAVYVAEHTLARNRGFGTGWIQASAAFGLFLALGVILIVRTLLGEDTFSDWGWRIPFLISLALLAVSVWIRLQLEETPSFLRLRASGGLSRAPLSEAFLRWHNLKLVLLTLAGLLMSHGVVWYTAHFYTLFFLQNVARLEARVVNELLLVAVGASVVLHIFFAWLSDKVGRRPVMLFGLGLAIVGCIPAFHLLLDAANPAAARAARNVPVTVIGAPQDCSVQFDLIGKSRFVTSCDIAKNVVANAGVPYRNAVGPAGSLARVRIGDREVVSVEAGSSPDSSGGGRKAFEENVKRALVSAGYPASADTKNIDVIGVLGALLVLVVAAAALYGPQAATLVEIFPTRIRYSALSLPYHIGVGWFGGFLPATAFAIVAMTGNIYAGLWYPVGIAIVGFLVTMLFLPETSSRDIDNIPARPVPEPEAG